MIFHVYRYCSCYMLFLSLFLCRVLSTDGIIESVKRRRYYEKPCRKRERKSYENCKRIYNTEMARKISFVSKTQRQDPWLGC
uniref:Mitochondrial ribosomal protein S21 n=1 Tax=Cyprinus carpio carpio TaxID=630221 RepID=A0A9J8ADU2_CYPCA